MLKIQEEQETILKSNHNNSTIKHLEFKKTL